MSPEGLFVRASRMNLRACTTMCPPFLRSYVHVVKAAARASRHRERERVLRSSASRASHYRATNSAARGQGARREAPKIASEGCPCEGDPGSDGSREER